MTRVLVSDSLAPQGVEVLKQADGLEVIERPGASPDELLELIPDVEGLVIRSGTKVTADVIARAEKLKVIGRAGIGVDNVDVPAATTATEAAGMKYFHLPLNGRSPDLAIVDTDDMSPITVLTIQPET